MYFFMSCLLMIEKEPPPVHTWRRLAFGLLSSACVDFLHAHRVERACRNVLHVRINKSMVHFVCHRADRTFFEKNLLRLFVKLGPFRFIISLEAWVMSLSYSSFTQKVGMDPASDFIISSMEIGSL